MLTIVHGIFIWFLLVKYDYLLVFLVLHHSKLNFFGFSFRFHKSDETVYVNMFFSVILQIRRSIHGENNL